MSATCFRVKKMNKPPSQRMLRVGELVRHALADMLTRVKLLIL